MIHNTLYIYNIKAFDYFGARYYSSDLSVWLSVDPMSDKYPSTSPFMYVRGNPVMLIDPNGLSDKRYGIGTRIKNWFKGDAWKNKVNKVASKNNLTSTTNADGTITATDSTKWSGNRENGAVGGVNDVSYTFTKDGYTTTTSNSQTQSDYSSSYKYGNSTQREKYGYYKGNTGGIITGTGLVTSMYGGAAQIGTDIGYVKYVVRGQNLARQAVICSKVANGFSVAGGVIGFVDNYYQSKIDFEHGNSMRGSIQAVQAGVYGAGLIFMAIPGGQLIGGALILSAGLTDMVEYFIENKE